MRVPPARPTNKNKSGRNENTRKEDEKRKEKSLLALHHLLTSSRRSSNYQMFKFNSSSSNSSGSRRVAATTFHSRISSLPARPPRVASPIDASRQATLKHQRQRGPFHSISAHASSSPYQHQHRRSPGKPLKRTSLSTFSRSLRHIIP